MRERTAAQILAGIAPDPAPPAVRAAVRGWLWFMDGVLADWLEHRDIDRDTLRGLLLGTLLGAVLAAGGRPPSALDLLQVDDEDERLVRGDHRRRALRAVAHVRRDDEQPPAALLHPDDALVPARDDPAGPRGNSKGSLPGSHDASNCWPLDQL